MKSFKYKLSLFIFSFVVLLSSCTNDLIQPQENPVNSTQNDKVTVEKGRLVFKSIEHFNKVVASLEGKTQEELNAWEKQNSFVSLRSINNSIQDTESKKLSLFNFPSYYETLLNADGEYVIGENLVWFNNGQKHFIPNRDEKVLSEVKLNPSLSKIHGAVGIVKSEILNPEIKTDASNWSFGNAYNVYVKYFNQWGDSGSKRRSTYQFNIWRDYNWEDNAAVYYFDRIFVKVIYEYQGSQWRRAGEPRKISWNFSYTTILNGVYGAVLVGVPTNGSRSSNEIETSSDYDIIVSGGPVTVGKGTGITGDSYNVSIAGRFTTYTTNDQTNSFHEVNGSGLFDYHP
ncbi:hypothetical protein [Flectobacillus longus]|uniref:hypothetical protein n=1 Tax=Flectobacillus longus TaxID=2984207 RepID=UPI0024B665C1|nr:hypothetical protein [Flectobacillus longus]MDI9878168.1 hypothetical protein [Flectobacillus longus]